MGSDCYKVSGDHIENYLPHDLYNLNVSYRTNFEDLERFPIQGVVVFVAENETQIKSFNDYISYFNEKERVIRNNLFLTLDIDWNGSPQKWTHVFSPSQHCFKEILQR